MDKSLEEKLIACLDALERGESVGAILARYPESAAQLRPMLETAQLLEQKSFFPSNATHQQAKQAFLGKATQIRYANVAPRRSWWRWLFKPALSLGVGLALVVVMAVWGAQSAVPGDALYGAKQASEQVQLLFAGGGTEGLSMQQQLNQERLREITVLLAERRTAEVNFEGVVEQAVGDVWQIERLPVVIQPTTDFAGFVGEGQLVHVRALTVDGQLLAVAITPLTAPVASPSPTVMATPTLPLTVTATVTGTIPPTQTQTGTAVATPTPTPSTTATETVPPVGTTAVPTAATPPTPTLRPSAVPSSSPTPSVTPAPQPSPDPEPEKTDEPEETDEPEKTEEPEETDEPEKTKEPEDNDNEDDD